MRCVVFNCANDSSHTSHVITYHIFPTESSLRAAWLEALHMTGWQPEERSVVCSSHFQREDLLVSSSGLRVVRAGAVPVVDVLVCRICFATDCKLYPLAAYKILSKAYETLTGLAMIDENLPPYVCSECARRMLNNARFRNMSLGAHSILLEIIKCHGYVTLESIQSVKGIQCPLSLNQTDYNLDIELAEKEEVYIDEPVDINKLWNKDVAIGGIKTEGDVINKDSHIEKQSIHNNEQAGIGHLSGLREHVALGGIKNEDNAVIDQEKHTIEDTINDNRISVSVDVDGFKVENDFEMNQDGDNKDLTNVDVEHEGEDYSSDDTLPLVETGQKVTLNTTGIQEVKKVLKDSTQEKIDTQRNPEANGTLLVNNRLSCDVCPYQTHSELHFLSHTKAHAAAESYSCNLCSYITIYKHRLICHFKVHSGEKSYSCDVCSKVFNHKVSLNKHLRIHSGKLPYTCNVCNKKFNQKDHLTIHLRKHSDEKPYACDICNRTFNQKGNLTKHLQIHSDEKPYSCETCKKTFNQKAYLTIHLRTHSETKPYCCYICYKTFSRKGYLTKHLRVHAGEKPRPLKYQ